LILGHAGSEAGKGLGREAGIIGLAVVEVIVLLADQKIAAFGSSYSEMRSEMEELPKAAIFLGA